MTDIQKAIFPYHNNTYKKDTAVKIINKDGSDFIIHFNLNGLLFSAKTARTFVEGLAKVGIHIENGSASNYGYLFCSQPFVDENAFGTRVCQSAAPFVQLDPRQFVVPSTNTVTSGTGSYQGMSQETQPFTPTVVQYPIEIEKQVTSENSSSSENQNV